jgi:Fe-Mn family superoxide dismutase
MPYTLGALPYPESALEPVLPEGLVRTHREWHALYVDRLNSLVGGTPWAGVPVEELLVRLRELPDELREPVRENAGGHLNHTLLWRSLAPDAGGEPNYEFLDDIERDFGSFPDFQAAMRARTASLEGQGWAWLVWNGSSLELTTTENEHTPLGRGHTPLLGIDGWDHAYQVAYGDRGTYVDALWRVIEWRAVEERFLEAEEATRQPRGRP